MTSNVQSLLHEIDNEMATTRRLLERVPEASADWKPHQKSMALGTLAAHIADLPGMGTIVFETESLDLMTRGKQEGFSSTAELLERLDRNTASARGALESASEEALAHIWTMSFGDTVLISQPRVAVIRTLFLNHHIHHRGQLSVYLRLLDVPLPSIYGPSADTPVA